MKEYERRYKQPYIRWTQEIIAIFIALHNSQNIYDQFISNGSAFDTYNKFAKDYPDIYTMVFYLNEIYAYDKQDDRFFDGIKDLDITIYDHYILKETLNRGFDNIKLITKWYIHNNRTIELVKIMKRENIDYRDFLRSKNENE